MKNEILKMALAEISKGVSAGLRDYLKHSITITTMILLLAGSVYAIYTLLEINAADRKEYKAELKEYAQALNAANMELGKCTEFRAAAIEEISGLKERIARLENKR